jgi:hypothetical protein
MIESALKSQTVAEQELESLICESNQHLHPLDEPFATNYQLHRWLIGSREEVYSDWLAWILDQLGSAADVFRLFGAEPPEQAEQWSSGSAERERPIPNGRLDIVERWPGRALLVVEVKLSSEESALTNQQERYRRWMARWPEPHTRAVLLVVDSEEGQSEGRFDRCGWREVCLALRRAAVQKAATGQIVHAALMLAFAGAVEQNLLCMHGAPLSRMRSGGLLDSTQIRQHLREFVRSAER